MKIIESIELEKAHVHLMNENLVKIIIKENAELDETDIHAINNAKNNFVKQYPYVVIFFAPKRGNISRKARELSASKEVCDGAICKAIVAPSKISVVISSFFINFMKPYAPIKMFSNETEALAWTNEMRKKAEIISAN